MRASVSASARAPQLACCEFCRTPAEVQPHGPHGELICFKCAMQDEATTRRRFFASLFIHEVEPWQRAS